MIFDSENQKNFIIETIKKYPCTYEEAVKISQSFMQDVVNGEVRPPAPQKEPTSQEVKN